MFRVATYLVLGRRRGRRQAIAGRCSCSHPRQLLLDTENLLRFVSESSGTLSSQILSVWCGLMDSICRPGPLPSDPWVSPQVHALHYISSLLRAPPSGLFRANHLTKRLLAMGTRVRDLGLDSSTGVCPASQIDFSLFGGDQTVVPRFAARTKTQRGKSDIHLGPILWAKPIDIVESIDDKRSEENPTYVDDM